MPRRLKTLIKLIFSSLIVLYLFSRAPLDQIFQSLKEAQISFIAGAIFLYLLAQVLSAYKWSLLAKPLGFEKKFIHLASYYFIGMFFNLFMLGSIGGDVVRAYYLGGKTRRIIPAGYSIFAERYTGGLALVTILSIALLVPFSDRAISSFLRWSVIGGAVMVWLITIFIPNLLRLFPRIRKGGEKIDLQKMSVYWDDPRLIQVPILISFIFQTLFILIIVLVGWGFGIKAPLHYFFIFVPLADLLSILPLTLNGVGIRESCYVFFLHLAGVETSTSLAFSLLCLVVVWSVSLLGGIIYLSGDFRIRMKDHVSGQPLKETGTETSFN